MKKSNLTDTNNALWTLIGDVYHQLVLLRQKELTEYHIPFRQLQVLHTLEALDSKSTISELARILGRKPNVISRQIVRMEKDGLIKRIKNTPKSNQLSIEFAQKGLDILKITKNSKQNTIDTVFSFLSDEDRKKVELVLNSTLIKIKERMPERL